MSKKNETLNLLKDLVEKLKPTGVFDDILEEINLEYKDIGRNDPCVCGSGKKYKKCCLHKKKLHIFKVRPKGQKNIWRRVQLVEDNTLLDFDEILKEEFKLDPCDHLSQFYSGKAFNSKGFGSIHPDGSGKGEDVLIKNLDKKVGDRFEYVYDFGSSFYLVIKLENIEALDLNTDTSQYPLVIKKNKPQFKKCSSCGKIATWVCIYCNENLASKKGLYCEKCMEDHDKDHCLEELFFEKI